MKPYFYRRDLECVPTFEFLVKKDVITNWVVPEFQKEKALDPDSFLFSVQCSYLTWYAYQHFGYDLDSNGGWFVSSADLLYSPHLEIVQIFGMDPEGFINLPIS